MPEPFENRLNEALTSLIHSRPVDGDAVRATAVRTMTDLYIEAVRRETSGTPAHFRELMLALLPHVPIEIRGETSRRLAHCEALPAEIARLLAADSHEVAAPMLRQSPLLGEADLLDAATGSCPRKALAVAGRSTLPRTVVAALLDREDELIAATLAETQVELNGAVASRMAVAEGLGPRAVARLIDVPGLSDLALSALFWRAGADARRRIIAILRRRSLPAPALSRGAGLHGIGSADPALAGTLLELASARRTAEMATQLSKALALPDRLGHRIVGDAGGEALAVAARAAGLSVEHVTSLVLLTARDAGESYQALRDVVDLAERLEPATGRYLISLWVRAATGQQLPRPNVARHDPAIALPPAAAGARPNEQSARRPIARAPAKLTSQNRGS